MEEHAAPSRQGRFIPLDALRAVAVLLVLGRHVPMRLVEADWPEAVAAWLSLWKRGGWIGVDLFFVLSGFLVSGLLFREYELYGELRIGRFLIRRGLKIYPAYYVMIALTVAAMDSYYRPALICELLFLQNVGPGVWAHTWSLAVEEHFYLTLALLFFYLKRRRTAGNPFSVLPRIALWSAGGCLALRLLNAAAFDYGHRTHLFPTGLRLDSLFFGVLLSYYCHFRHAAFIGFCRRRRTELLLAGTALLVPPFVAPLETTPFIYTFGFVLLYLGSGMVLCALLASTAEPSRAARALAWVGSYSYSIYLWHVSVQEMAAALCRRTGLSSSAEIALYLAGAIVFGIAMAKLVEMPVLHLRDRFFPSRGRPLGASGTSPPTRSDGTGRSTAGDPESGRGRVG